jgi:hypothetical protein
VAHEDLLTYHSEFFRAALGGGFKEAEEKTVRLPTEDTTIFEFFQFWMYYGRFPSEVQKDDRELANLWAKEPDSDFYSGRLIAMYVFGDQYQVTELRRYALDTIFDHIVGEEDALMPETSSTKLAYSKLSPSSPMIRFLVDAFHGLGGVNCYEEDVRHPRALLQAVLRRYACHATEALDLCNYHDHETEDEKKSCQTEREKRKKTTG